MIGQLKSATNYTLLKKRKLATHETPIVGVEFVHSVRVCVFARPLHIVQSTVPAADMSVDYSIVE